MVPLVSKATALCNKKLSWCAQKYFKINIYLWLIYIVLFCGKLQHLFFMVKFYLLNNDISKSSLAYSNTCASCPHNNRNSCPVYSSACVSSPTTTLGLWVWLPLPLTTTALHALSNPSLMQRIHKVARSYTCVLVNDSYA